MVLMQVTVPEGLQGGDAMSVTVGEQEFTLTVPDGVVAGDLLEVDLPVEMPEEASQQQDTETVIVEVPTGVSPGEAFSVQAAWGGIFEIVVPDGVGEGDSIEVSLPTQESHEASLQQQRESNLAPSPPPREPSPPALSTSLAPATRADELVGRRVKLVKLVAKPVMNGAKRSSRHASPVSA